jgi:hypothetical protein
MAPRGPIVGLKSLRSQGRRENSDAIADVDDAFPQIIECNRVFLGLSNAGFVKLAGLGRERAQRSLHLLELRAPSNQ